MLAVDDIFDIRNDEEFRRMALKVFRYQAEHCRVYADYLRLTECNIDEVTEIEQIPMLPIELFKTCDVYAYAKEPQIVYTSSATTSMVASHHAVADVSVYERSFLRSFEMFYGDIEQWSIYALLPSYLQRKGSSLVYMADTLIRKGGSGGFYLDEYEKLLDDMARDCRPKILLGVTYALLDLAERYAPKLSDTIVMETGGMKGHRQEMPKAEMHALLCDSFGLEQIHSEYGMAELLSQAYSKGGGIFNAPPWLRVLIRDVNNPLARLAEGSRGGIDIIDLANIYSCSFIATQDLGQRFADGSFAVEGRLTAADIRGCNLLVQ